MPRLKGTESSRRHLILSLVSSSGNSPGPFLARYFAVGKLHALDSLLPSRLPETTSREQEATDTLPNNCLAEGLLLALN
jgi:hypothetical protein